MADCFLKKSNLISYEVMHQNKPEPREELQNQNNSVKGNDLNKLIKIYPRSFGIDFCRGYATTTDVIRF